MVLGQQEGARAAVGVRHGHHQGGQFGVAAREGHAGLADKIPQGVVGDFDFKDGGELHGVTPCSFMVVAASMAARAQVRPARAVIGNSETP